MDALKPARPSASTFEIVELRALRDPQRLAVAEGLRRYSYGDLYRHAVRFSRLLDGAGIRRGQRVAVSTPGFFIELVLAIALENLGAASATFMTASDSDADVLFGLVDWVISEQPQSVPPGVRFLHLDAALVERVEAMDPFDGTPYPRVALEPHEPQRLTRTSGSTGKSKWMLISRHIQEAYIRIPWVSPEYTPDSVALIAAPFLVNGAMVMALGCLCRGAAVVSARFDELHGLVPTNFLGLPLHLERFVASLPPGYVPPRPIVISTIGGFVPAPLRQQVAAALRAEVTNLYGANEIGAVCPYLDAQGTGLLMYGVDVRIVDEAGRDLPDGQVGAIVARTTTMVSGYLNDAEATRGAFRDGWFHTDDRGAIVGLRRLRLAGRQDDLVTLGGIKVPAHMVEERVRRAGPVREAAVVAINADGGTATLGIAVIADPGVDRTELARRLQEGLDLGTATGARVAFVETLPRTANGKIDRVALHRLFEPGA